MKRTILFLLLALSVFTLHAFGSARISNRTSLPVSQNMTDSLIVVKGVVKDAEDGEPVIGADVYVRGTDPDKRVSGVNHTRTNLDGEFELRVAPGNMLVTECIGYLSDTSKVEPNMVVRLERDWEMLNEVVLCAQFLYVASGVVMDAEDRTLLPDAAIFIRENVSEKTKTDEKGKFKLLYPPKDGAMLEIELPGYLPYTCKAAPNLIVLLEPDPMAPEKVREAKSRHLAKQDEKTARTTVKGIVVDAESGAPILGCYVYVQGSDPDKRSTRFDNAISNTDGEFELRVAPGTVMETACLGYLPSTCKAEPDMVIKLKLDPTLPDELPFVRRPDHYGPEYDWTPTQNKTDSLIVVKGVVKDAEDGTPIIGACVYVQGTDQGKAAVRDVDYSLTNQNGEFSLRVAPGALLGTECLVYLPITCKAEPDMVIELKRDLDALENAIKTLSMYDVRTLCH